LLPPGIGQLGGQAALAGEATKNASEIAVASVAARAGPSGLRSDMILSFRRGSSATEDGIHI
jgi:hypothetical protein